MTSSNGSQWQIYKWRMTSSNGSYCDVANLQMAQIVFTFCPTTNTLTVSTPPTAIVVQEESLETAKKTEKKTTVEQTKDTKKTSVETSETPVQKGKGGDESTSMILLAIIKDLRAELARAKSNRDN